MLRLCYSLALLVPAAMAGAQDSPAAGHSFHGEVFNEGPRQRPRWIGGTGKIEFAISSKSPSARRFFLQGVGQLHGFWYFEAERSFRQVAAIDPDCAMAYWGMAMANVDNEARARGFANQAWTRRKSTSKREQRYIEAIAKFYAVAKDPKPAKKKPSAKTSDKAAPAKKPANKKPANNEPAKSDQDGKDDAASTGGKPAKVKRLSRTQEIARRRQYVKDMETLIHEFPEDIEAKAFLANQLWLDVRKGVPIHSRLANDALLAQVFAKNPMHPAHHYAIHLWDRDDTAGRNVDHAVKSGPSAPSIAHMWHMGGHTFDKLGRFHDAAWQQEASARVDHRHMIQDRIMPHRIHNYAHNQEWCVRSLLAVGRIDDALSLAKNLVELPRHPEHNHLGRRGGAAWYGRRRVFDVLTSAELWEEALRLANTMHFEAGKKSEDRALRLELIARAHVALGKTTEATRAARELRSLVSLARQERGELIDEAEQRAKKDGLSTKQSDEALANALKLGTRRLRNLEKRADALDARIAFAKTSEKAKRKAALAKMKKAGFDKLELARLELEVGDTNAAKKTLASLRKGKSAKKVIPLAQLVHTLFVAGKREEAKKSFAELRELSSWIDLEAAPFARLAPIARAFGHGDDWRKPYVMPKDVAERPRLEELGPFRWSPSAAADWTLQAPGGKRVRLADYRGKPVLVVFFLGFGCVHCVEQLQALAPMTKDFAKAGIEIVTIGTDKLEDVQRSLSSDPNAYSFPILADPQARVFRQYRCWDDFENMALHGTFLIDANGLVRWQDISYEPFMKTEFLLRECKRLLALRSKGAAQR